MTTNGSNGTPQHGTGLVGSLQGNQKQPDVPQLPISEQLPDNIRRLETTFAQSSDIIIKHWNYGPEQQHTACSFYYETLVQEDTVNYMKTSLQDLVTHEVGPGAAVTPQDIISFFERDGVSKKRQSFLRI